MTPRGTLVRILEMQKKKLDKLKLIEKVEPEVLTSTQEIIGIVEQEISKLPGGIYAERLVLNTDEQVVSELPNEELELDTVEQVINELSGEFSEEKPFLGISEREISKFPGEISDDGLAPEE